MLRKIRKEFFVTAIAKQGNADPRGVIAYAVYDAGKESNRHAVYACDNVAQPDAGRLCG